MKTNLFIIASICLTSLSHGQTAANVPPATPYSVVSRPDGNSEIWERTLYFSGPSGQVIARKERYTEVASGLNFKDPATGEWKASSETITVLADGSCAALNASCKAYFPADIYDGTIKLITEDGIELQSAPLCLAYGSGTDNSVVIAALTNSVGELASSNEIIYPGAMTGPGISADLEYVFHKSGLEQNLVIRSPLPAPEQYSLDSNDPDLRVQLMTEFINCPPPAQSVGAANVQDGLRDTTLSWGGLKMIHGTAFLTEGADQAARVNVFKSWAEINGRRLLVEQTPWRRISPELASLPSSASGGPAGRLPAIAAQPAEKENRLPTGAARLNGVQNRSVMAGVPLGKLWPKLVLPPRHLAEAETHSVRMAGTEWKESPGVCLDYVTVGTAATNWVWEGDQTFLVSSLFYLYGTTVCEGSSVVKLKGSGQIAIDENGAIDCRTGPNRPCVFTSWNDNSIGYSISGSSGSPNFQDVSNPCLTIYATNATLNDLRFCYGRSGVYDPNAPDSLGLWDCQFMNVATPVSASQIGLYNVLIGYSANEASQIRSNGAAEITVGGNLVAENVTADSGYSFIAPASPGPVLALTNCLVTGQMLTNVNRFVPTLLTNGVVWAPSPASPVYQTCGGGNYYLTNNSPYRGIGTANIDPYLLADLAQKTTWPPIVYSGTNISSLQTLGQAVPRNTNSSPDIGYSYDPMDYVFGGCTLQSNLTIAAGTDVGWFYGSDSIGIRDGVALRDGAQLSFNGTATQPCYYPRHQMVQEGGNGNWNDNSGWTCGAVTFEGSGNTNLTPCVSGAFAIWTADGSSDLMRDDWAYGAGGFRNCEFYDGSMATYDMPWLYFTNCLFFRNCVCFWDQNTAVSFSFENCTYYNGGITMCRYSGQPSSFWLIENSSFDGTALTWADNFNGGAAHTAFDHNAYNTNNLSGRTYFQFSGNGTNEVVSPYDLMVTNYNWQSSWFGDFYLPANSPLLYAGSTNAGAVGLYHFTVQTNQIPDGTNIVTIGYHYVATDQYGNPLDSNGDGIPDYIEDANGNGLADNGESPWYYSTSSGLSATAGLLLYTPLK